MLAGARVHRSDGARGSVELAGPRRALGRWGVRFGCIHSGEQSGPGGGGDVSNGGQVLRVHVDLDAAVQELH